MSKQMIRRRAFLWFLQQSLVGLLASGLLCMSSGWVRADSGRVGFTMSVIPPSVRAATPTGSSALTQPIAFDFVLAPRNQAQMDKLAKDVSTPGNQNYGKYLTPAQFKDRFGPTDAAVAAVRSFATRHGFVIEYVSKNNMLVRVHGTVAQVNEAFNITMKDYWDPVESRNYHAPDGEPTVDSSVAPYLMSVIGLSTKAVLHSFLHQAPASLKTVVTKLPGRNGKTVKYFAGPEQLYYSGHQGLAPSDTTTVYDMGGSQSYGYTGGGEVLGLFEEGTCLSSDIATWENYYGIRDVPRTAISIDGYNTSSSPGGASPEYVLDVDMLETWAHGASSMRVYDNYDTDVTYSDFSTQITDSLNAAASDSPLPTVMSISYGYSEIDQSSSDLNAEESASVNLVLQGQSVFCSSGDQGAWTDESVAKTDPNVSDPSGQPYICSVGGTTLTDNSSYQYVSETSWYDASDTRRGQWGTGGGGGVSQYWGIPYWQVGSFSTNVNPQGSTTNRNQPDVSLFGNFDSGEYDVYVTTGGANGWSGFNGTSASSPLWAGFMATVNQERVNNGQPLIGLATPAIYAAAEGPLYGSAFHDIADGSTNGVYKAVADYDNSTGWGSFDGANLLVLLAGVFVNSGASGTENGTILNPWPTVEDGISSAGLSPTTPIEISPGSYDENITISKPVTLNAYGPGTVTIGS